MSISIDDAYDTNGEYKSDFSQNPNIKNDPFCLGGRNVEKEPAINNTDEKTGWVSRKAMMQRSSGDKGGNWEGGFEMTYEWGGKDPGKLHIEGSGKYTDGNGNGVEAKGHYERDENGKNSTGMSVNGIEKDK